jgi:hypothetical protein
MTSWLLLGSGFALGVGFIVLSAIVMILIITIYLIITDKSIRAELEKVVIPDAAHAASAPSSSGSKRPSAFGPGERPNAGGAPPSSWGGLRSFQNGLFD